MKLIFWLVISYCVFDYFQDFLKFWIFLHFWSQNIWMALPCTTFWWLFHKKYIKISWKLKKIFCVTQGPAKNHGLKVRKITIFAIFELKNFERPWVAQCFDGLIMFMCPQRGSKHWKKLVLVKALQDFSFWKSKFS